MRSCDTVSAGAFFPQANFEVPQEEMRQHRGQHVAVAYSARRLPLIPVETCHRFQSKIATDSD
jgi:hypothetical protein